jgi:hypothetical protein
MRSRTRLIIGILFCLGVTSLLMLWAASMMASMFAFRSPLADSPPPPGEALGERLTRRVVIVLIDALRDDTSRRGDVMPFLNELRAKAAFATMHSRAPSFSQTGNTVLFTGGWQELSDAPLFNLEGADRRPWSQDNLFSAAHRAGLKTAAAADLSFRGEIPQGVLDTLAYTEKDGAPADAELMTPTLRILQDPSYALVLIHFDQVDYAGHHLGGAASPAWDQAAHQADAYLQQIVGALDFAQDTLLVVSDHGQLTQGGHGGPEAIVLREPWVLAGRAVKPGDYGDVEMVDMAPTVATLLGTNIPASSEGQALTEMLMLAPAQSDRIEAAVRIQQAALAVAYASAIGGATKGEVPLNPSRGQASTVIRAAQAARLARERLPRVPAALLIAVIPAICLYGQRRPGRGWYFIGAAVYLGVFNFLFLVVLRRTYSISTVETAQGLLGTAAGVNFLSFLCAWLLVSGPLGTFSSRPSRATEQTLGLTLVVLYVLVLATLPSLAINGLVVRWAVPELRSMFTAFFAMLAALFVCITGLLLMGVSALVPMARRRFGHFEWELQ